MMGGKVLEFFPFRDHPFLCGMLSDLRIPREGRWLTMKKACKSSGFAPGSERAAPLCCEQRFLATRPYLLSAERCDFT